MSTAAKRRLTPAEYLALEVASDIVVFCGKPVFGDGVNDTAVNPLLVAEVLSDSTEKYARGVKFGHCRRLP